MSAARPTLMLVAAQTPPRTPASGGFGAVAVRTLADGGDFAARLRAAAGMARDAGRDWLAFTGTGESLADDALDLVAPALDLFDAIFGAVHRRGSPDKVERPSRLAFDDAAMLPHALLNWWVPQAHFVRPATALAALERVPEGTADSFLSYLFALWSDGRCLKSAQPLLEVDERPRPLSGAGRETVLARLEARPVDVPVQYGETRYVLPYTGRNPGIEREQTRGQFFEAMELEALRLLAPAAPCVVDVGANTGNHTVFFAGPMRAKMVVPLEPLPRAVSALRHAVSRNGLANVDLSRLGIGASDREGRAGFVLSERGGLGSTGLRTEAAGEIRVSTLDRLVPEHVDVLKIDVEGMEMEVLAGAAGLIERCRPLIFIEIANRNMPAFSAWLERSAYRVERIFTDKGHANFIVMPRESATISEA
ncbi:MAG: FkbM family methyltransferase [Rhizobiaceae bacterium]